MMAGWSCMGYGLNNDGPLDSGVGDDLLARSIQEKVVIQFI